MFDHTVARSKPFPSTRKARSTEGARLARSITWAGSKQTFLIARLLVDRRLRDDCCRAYAYFRWADDVIDITSGSREERIAFVNRQLSLINSLYGGEQRESLTTQEELLADLIESDRSKVIGLHSFIHNFIALLEFDAHRRGQLISLEELEWYSGSLAKAVTDGIQYFIGHEHRYPKDEDQYKAVLAAHITHMLRDMVEDLDEGYINIPREYIQAHGIDTEQLDGQPFREWVRKRVELARQYLEQGKRYLDQLEVLRCKLAGYWYCARYEGVLRTIEKDEYILRSDYRYGLGTLVRIAWVGLFVTVRHIARRYIQASSRRSTSQTLPGNSRSNAALENQREKGEQI